MNQGTKEAPTESSSSVRGSDPSGVRAHNERLVLTLIRQRGPLAKAEIARLTGLSAQTVSVIMRSLEADGLLKRGTPIRGKVGQPSVPMSLNPTGAFFLGLKVGRRSLDLILTDFNGKVEGRVHITHRYPTPDSVVRFTNDAISHLLEALPPDQRDRVAGLGIAQPFRLWDWAKPLGVEPEKMEDWRSRQVAEEIAENWPFSVYLCNDASAACGAELVFGDAGKPSDFLYFYVGFFVGGGLVLDDNLFVGRTGNAAALGSLPIGIKNDSVEQLVDVASLVVLERMLLEQGGSSEMMWTHPQHWTVPDDIVQSWLSRAAEGLAYAILSSASLIDFECVLIDGWMPEAIRAELRRQTEERLNGLSPAGIVTPEVRQGSIGPDARALGAASLPLSDRFLVDRNAFLKA